MAAGRRAKTHEFGLVFRISRLTWHELSMVCAEETRKGGGRDAEGPATENIDRTPVITCV